MSEEESSGTDAKGIIYVILLPILIIAAEVFFILMFKSKTKRAIATVFFIVLDIVAVQYSITYYNHYYQYEIGDSGRIAEPMDLFR